MPNRHCQHLNIILQKKINFSHSLPYNWRTPTAFLLTIALQYAVTVLISSLVVILLIVYIGFCFMITRFIIDIKRSLINLNDDIVAEKKKNVRSIKKLCELLRFHADVIQLSYYRYQKIQHKSQKYFFSN